MSWLADNVFENPMMAEVSRFKQLIRGKGLSSIGLRTSLFLAILIAGFMGWIVAYSEGSAEPNMALYGQLVFCCLAIPLRFYGTIAGEREKRSWELLRVAPVTNLQLVLGKFAAMTYMVFLIHAIFFIPFIFSIMKYGRFDSYPYASPYGTSISNNLNYSGLFWAEVYSFLTALLVAALTLFFSARSKRSYTALALTLGSIAILFVFVPLFTSMLSRFFQFMSPFSAFAVLGSRRFYGGEDFTMNMAPIYASLVCTAFLIVVFVIYAANTLAFADNLVKFIPRKKTIDA